MKKSHLCLRGISRCFTEKIRPPSLKTHPAVVWKDTANLGHSLTCLPGKIFKTLWIFHRSLHYCPVKERTEYLILLVYGGSFKTSVLGTPQNYNKKTSSASRTFISNCLQRLSTLSLRRQVCDCPTAPNTPRKNFHYSVQSHL